jgi:8-amino-7-oxononanoate synthase
LHAVSRPAPAPAIDTAFGVTATLAAIDRDGLRRERRVIGSAQGPEIEIDGRGLLNFCSNDYLGLAADPRLAASMSAAAGRFGTGAGASQLVCGRMRPHAELEEAIAEWLGRDRALLFSSGYQANLAIAPALIRGRNDLVAGDRANHASLIDAARLAGARLHRYRHGDTAALGQLLRGRSGRKLVLTDGVFSMEGDRAPLREMAVLCAGTGALLVVDDAHGLGVLGEGGGGLLEEQGLGQSEVPLLVGTFGKALGTAGAFVAGAASLIETLVQRARSYIYTTAPSPALAAATLTAIGIVREEHWRRQRLRDRIGYFRSRAAAAGIALQPSDTPIQPLLIGDSERAAALSRLLYEAGILATAMRPPTVPRGTARLRFTLSAAHGEAHIDRLFTILPACLKN